MSILPLTRAAGALSSVDPPSNKGHGVGGWGGGGLSSVDLPSNKGRGVLSSVDTPSNKGRGGVEKCRSSL